MATETLRPTANTGNWVDSSSAYDTSDTTYARNEFLSRTEVFSGFPDTTETYTALNLNVTWSINEDDNDHHGLEYSLNGGATWNDIRAVDDSTVTAKHTDTIVLSPSQDISDIQIRASYTIYSPRTGDAQLWLYDINTEGTYTSGTSVTVVDTGVTATFTLGTTAVTGDATVNDTGVTGTFTLNDVLVTAIAPNVTVNDTGVTATFTLNEVSVSIGSNITVVDEGVTATFTMNDVEVSADAEIVDEGVTATFTLNDVTVVGDAVVEATAMTGTFTLNDVTVDVVVPIPVTINDTGVTATFSMNDVVVSAPNASHNAEALRGRFILLPVEIYIDGELQVNPSFNKHAHLTQMRIKREAGYY